MYRFVGLVAILAAGFAASLAWSSTPPIIVGPVTTSGPQDTTTAATSSTATTAPTTTTTTTTTTVPGAAPFGQSASLAASSLRARARPVALTLTLRYEMQCGSPGRGSLVLGLPSQVRVPSGALPALLDGKRVALARAPGNKLVAPLPTPPAVMCDEISEGTLKLVVTKAADIGNPVRPGLYAFTVHVGSRAFRTTLRITA